MFDLKTRQASITKLAELVKGINFAMLTTTDASGHLHSRPMGTQQVDEEEAVLWFFTADDSLKTREIANSHQVNVSYASPNDNRYVSVSGMAEVVHDIRKNHELWNPLLKAWFPQGVDDPHIALLRVDIQQVEYWDYPSSKMVQLAGFVKSIVTGEKACFKTLGGEHQKIDLQGYDENPAV